MDSLSQMLDIGGQVDIHIAYHIATADLHTSAECCAHTTDVDSFVSYLVIFFTEHFCDLRSLILRAVIHYDDLIVRKINFL